MASLLSICGNGDGSFALSGLDTTCTALQEACLQGRGPSSHSQLKLRQLALPAPTFQTNFGVCFQLRLDFSI